MTENKYYNLEMWVHNFALNIPLIIDIILLLSYPYGFDSNETKPFACLFPVKTLLKPIFYYFYQNNRKESGEVLYVSSSNFIKYIFIHLLFITYSYIHL